MILYRYTSTCYIPAMHIRVAMLLYIMASFTRALSDVIIRKVTYNISENLPLGYRIGNLYTGAGLDTDPNFNAGNLNRLKFTTLSNESALNISLATETGDLVVIGNIDREYKCAQSVICAQELDIHVRSLQNNSQFNIIKVTFFIMDKNDNDPMFPQRVFIRRLIESAPLDTRIPLPYAEDLDSPEFGVSEYQIVPSTNIFSIHKKRNPDGSEDVWLRLDRKLDYERQKFINLTLIAYDGGYPLRSGSMEIVIAVDDANDHIPSFANSTYEVNVIENAAIGTTLIRVQAIDQDTGVNSQIHYKFSQRTQIKYNRFFAIDETTGDIIIQGIIDYESHHEFHLSVIGQDMGPNSHSVDTAVIVRVSDENDCIPQIDINTLDEGSTEMGVAKIWEESPTGTFVAHVSVSDKDSLDFGSVSCDLVSAYFSLENLYNDEYQIVTKKVFNREIESVYDVTLTCQDGGDNPNVVSQRIQVRILDINDHRPSFRKQVYIESLSENNYKMRDILRVTADDSDIGKNGNITYSIERKMRQLFHINSKSGLVKAIQSFDRETEEKYTFKVFAKDGGDPPKIATAEVVINIIDVNDEKPEFIEDSYCFEVYESAPPGTIIGTVSATDRDGIPFNAISYSIIQGYLGSFSINPASGEIKMVKNIDREERGQYILSIEAKNNGSPVLNSIVNVTIDVLDVNDNKPRFIFPSAYNHTVQIPTNIPSGYAITRLIARDRDKGPNGKIDFDIIDGGEDNFEIPNTSNVIITLKALELSDKKVFNLKLRARDNGSSPSETLAVLNVVVNKTLAIGISSRSSQDNFIIGANLNIVIIISAALACVIFFLIIGVMCIYCQKKTRDRKPECAYDPFQVREDTVETFQDNDGQFDSLSRPQILRSVEYGAPALHGFQLDCNYSNSMDDSGLQLEELMYHQRKPENNGKSCSTGNLYVSSYHTEKPVKTNSATNDCKKADSKMYKEEIDQDSTYSGDGSNPDSGKGPSEEGDNIGSSQHNHVPVNLPPPLPPVLEEDHRNVNNLSGIQNGGINPEVSPNRSCFETNRNGATAAKAQQYHHPQSHITGISMCKCKSCCSHNRGSVHFATVLRHKDNSGTIIYDTGTNSLPKSASACGQSIEKVPRVPPRVPSRSSTTRTMGKVGVSPFGSCRDLEIAPKSVTFKPDASIAIYSNHSIESHYSNMPVHNGSNTSHKTFHTNNSISTQRSPMLTHSNVQQYEANNQMNQRAPLNYQNNLNSKALVANPLSTTKSMNFVAHDSEIDLNSSSTSGSYMVEHMEIIDTKEQSQWNIKDSLV